MESKSQAQTIVEVMDEIRLMLDNIEREHIDLCGDWFGRPKIRHHVLLGQHRVLTKLNSILFNRYSHIPPEQEGSK